MSFPIRIKDCYYNITTVNVSKEMKISTVKSLFKEKTQNNFSDDPALFFKGQMLNDEKTVEDYKIKPGKILYILSLEQKFIA